MPSPTERTVPTSETWASLPKLAIWSRMTFEISAARISMFSLSKTASSPSPFHCVRERVQFGPDRTVDHLAADLDDEPAEDRRIDREVDGDVAAGAGLEIGLQRRDLIVGQRMRRDDLGGDLAAMARGEHVERADDVRDLREAAVPGED